MASPFKVVGFAAREELTSSDVMRSQKLWSRALQEEMRLASLDDASVPIDALTLVPTMTPNAGVYTVTMSPGEGLFNSSAGVTADDSTWQVIAWDAQTLTFTTPNGVNPRIDLVVAQIASTSSDVEVRNILVDPVNRTVVPTAVPKTIAPGSSVGAGTIQVIAGTAAATPLPPAVPVGTFPLFEVYVPAAVADATSFKFLQRTWRRAPYPFAGLTGVLQGVDLRWSQVNPAAADSTLQLSLSTTRRHKVLIDGELLDFTGLAQVFQDLGGNNPFNSAAPTSTDKPYYIYLVGGRHNPQGWLQTGTFTPVAIVESLIQPNQDTGHPNTPIRDPRTGGTTTLGAVYVGLGWVFRNTTHRRAVMIAGNFAFAAGGAFESLGAQTLTGATFNYPPLASAPATGTRSSGAAVIAELRGSGVTGTHEVWISPSVASPELATTNGVPFIMRNADATAAQARLWYDPNVGPIFNVYQGLNGDSLTIVPSGYQINAIRFDGQAFSA